jgi:D-alanyl-D-alanine dipeptidase
VSEPDFYAEAASSGLDSQAMLFDQRRKLLASVLGEEGFVCHPNEWWHFSYGDQLWAWRSGRAEAIYGRCDQALSSSLTA